MIGYWSRFDTKLVTWVTNWYRWLHEFNSCSLHVKLIDSIILMLIGYWGSFNTKLVTWVTNWYRWLHEFNKLLIIN